MACASTTFEGLNEHDKHWSNWNGNTPFVAEEYFEPADTAAAGPPDGLSQLVHVVARATKEGKGLKAIGSGWAFEDIAASDDWVVCLRRLTRELDYVVPAALTDTWRDRQTDDPRRPLVHVEAGIEIGALNTLLASRGLGMRALGGRNGQRSPVRSRPRPTAATGRSRPCRTSFARSTW